MTRYPEGRQEIVDGLEAVDGDEVGSLALEALAHQQRLLGAMPRVLGALVAFVDEHQSADFILLVAVSPIFESQWREFCCQRGPHGQAGEVDDPKEGGRNVGTNVARRDPDPCDGPV